MHILFYIITLLFGILAGVNIQMHKEKPKPQIEVVEVREPIFISEPAEACICDEPKNVTVLVPVEKLIEVPVNTNDNRIRMSGGYGPNGLKSNNTSISVDRGIIGAIGYDRRIYKRLSIGAEIETNGAVKLGFGLDF